MADTSPILQIRPRPVDNGLPADIQAFHDFWQNAAGARWAPTWRDIDLLQIPSPQVRYVTVSDVLDDGDYYFRYWGSGHAAYHAMDFSQKNLSDMHFPWAKKALGDQYGHVVKTKKPWLFEVTYENIRAPALSYRAPLSDDGETVSAVFSLVPREHMEDELRAWHFDPFQKP